MTSEDIKAALGMLDPQNDEHWTADGHPRVDIVNEILGKDASVTRQQITDADPTFNREAARDAAAQSPEAPEETPAPEPMTLLESLKAERAHKEEILLEMVRRKGDLEAEISRTQREIGNLNTRIDQATPYDDNQQAIRNYLRVQHERRMARASGQPLAPHAAPIDAVMAQTARSRARPTFPSPAGG